MTTATATKAKPTVVETKPTPEDEAQRAKLLARLNDLTRDIQTAQDSFKTIADGVYEIDKNKLYVLRQSGSGEAYASLADYTADQFQFSAVDTSRYRNGGEVLKVLRDNGISMLPRNESQTRALWKVYLATKEKNVKEGQSDDQRKAALKKAWDKVVSVWGKVKDGKATAERIEVEGKVKKGTVTVKAHARSKAPGHPVHFDVIAEKEDVKALEDALGLKSKMEDGMAVFVPKSRTNFELMLNKISNWFGEKGPRTIDIHLSK